MASRFKANSHFLFTRTQRMVTYMALDQTGTRDGQKRNALLHFVSATVVSLLFAVPSMMLTALIVRLAAADQPQPFKIAVVVAGTMIGACVGSWLAQPWLSRTVTEAVLSHENARDPS